MRNSPGHKCPRNDQSIAGLIDKDLRLHVKILKPVNKLACLPDKGRVENPRKGKVFYKLGVYSENQLGQIPGTSFKSCYRKNAKVFADCKDKYFRFALRCGTVSSFSKETVINLIRIWDLKVKQSYARYKKMIKSFIFSAFTSSEREMASERRRTQTQPRRPGISGSKTFFDTKSGVKAPFVR